MLPDPERKLLRIIGNFTAIRRRTPMIHELTIKTGRNEKRVWDSLATLAKEGFIEWDRNDPETILIIRAWEDPPPEDYRLFTE
jgi:predicted transcriptional regulator